MLKRFSFWLWTASILQLLSAALHSVSFFVDNPPANDTEKQLDMLMKTYKLNLGAGFSPTMADLMNSLSMGFMLLFVLAGVSNIYLWKQKIPVKTMKGVMAVNSLVFGACFLYAFTHAFIIPVVCTGLVFVCCLVAYLSAGSDRLRS